MNPKHQLSIIICTYNRGHILSECLNALAKEILESNQSIGVIIINNNSTDNTQEIINQFTSKHPGSKHFFEERTGLSHARNLGYKNAQSDWVLYLDDDAKVHPGFVKRAIWVINNYDFDCFGGVHLAWYIGKKPHWLPDHFGARKFYSNQLCEVHDPSGYAHGMVMAFKTSILKKLGGFKAEYGMRGNQIGYSEETEIQFQMQKRNYKIGFDPELKVDHLVGQHKYYLSWHLKSIYRLSYDLNNFRNLSLWIIMIDFVKGIGKIVLRKFPNLLFKKNYYWQNFLIDFLSPFLILTGRLYNRFTKK